MKIPVAQHRVVVGMVDHPMDFSISRAVEELEQDFLETWIRDQAIPRRNKEVVEIDLAAPGIVLENLLAVGPRRWNRGPKAATTLVKTGAPVYKFESLESQNAMQSGPSSKGPQAAHPHPKDNVVPGQRDVPVESLYA